MDMASLVHLFVYLIIVGCILGLLYYLITIVPIPEPFKGWLRILLIVIVVLALIFWLLSMVGGGPGLRLGKW